MNSFINSDHIKLVTSNKSDGNMSFHWGPEKEVRNNINKFLDRSALNHKDCVVMEVEHGDSVKLVNSSNKISLVNDPVPAEALITNERNVALFLLTADCLPITLYDKVNKVTALAHCGWKPTNLKLIIKVINILKEEFNSDPQDLISHIGPGIHKESYVFTDPVQKSLPEWLPFLKERSTGETEIDLVGYNLHQLLQAGVRRESISIDPTDTASSKEYFSHYRSVRQNEPEGRFVTVLTLL